MDPQLLLPLGAGLVVEQVRLCDEIVHLTVRCEAAGRKLPGMQRLVGSVPQQLRA